MHSFMVPTRTNDHRPGKIESRTRRTNARGRPVILLQPNDEVCEVMRRFSNELLQLHVVDNVFWIISKPLLDITYTVIVILSYAPTAMLINSINQYISTVFH